ncbi:MAG: helix-turn-helix transcriptional regulator [Cyanobacteria bacterium P01_A01_bin.123]
MDTLRIQLHRLKQRGSQLDNDFLESVLEGFIDGVLILTDQGDLHHANALAYEIIDKFCQSETETQLINQEVSRIYQAIAGSQDLYGDQTVIVESELDFEILGRLRLRARWSTVKPQVDPIIWITLEDQQRSLQAQAILEVEKYGFTARETEVWLRRKARVPYREIAQELFITVNTVKKHVKNIRVKIENYGFRQDMRLAN